MFECEKINVFVMATGAYHSAFLQFLCLFLDETHYSLNQNSRIQTSTMLKMLNSNTINDNNNYISLVFRLNWNKEYSFRCLMREIRTHSFSITFNEKSQKREKQNAGKKRFKNANVSL